MAIHVHHDPRLICCHKMVNPPPIRLIRMNSHNVDQKLRNTMLKLFQIARHTEASFMTMAGMINTP